MKDTKYSLQQILDACASSGGSKMKVSEILGISPTTFVAYQKRYPEEIKKALEDANVAYKKRTDEEIVLEAERQLMRKVKQGNFNAIRFVLETKGSQFGWGKVEKIDFSLGLPSWKNVIDVSKEEQPVLVENIPEDW